jgi:hypothetical protein
MNIYDLCVAWNWIYDADFIGLLEKSCQAHEISLLQITTSNLPQMLNALVGREAGCRVFFDRASDEDPQFLPLVQWVREDSIHSINAYEHASRTWDKARLHNVLVSHGLNVPTTIILPPYIKKPDIPSIDLSPLGEQFTLKPAHGSGGVGVMTNASTWEQVLSVRREHATDHYLLQAHITPIKVGDHLAWFRIIYSGGEIYPCWWDPFSHIYTPVTDTEKVEHGLGSLEEVVQAISRICKLDLFSTEIAFTSDRKFVVVDYVNDQIDLRLQSRSVEGVPDAIVVKVAEQLVDHVIHHRGRNRHTHSLGNADAGSIIEENV